MTMAEPGRRPNLLWTRQVWHGLLAWLGRPLWLVAVGPALALLSLLVAYQSPLPVTVRPGTSYGRPHVVGFHEPEHAPGLDYAYTREQATLHFPGIGHAPARLYVRMGGGVAGVRQTFAAGGVPLAEVPAGTDLTTYIFALPAEASRGGSLLLSWEGAAAPAPGDPRRLGIAVERVTWVPAGGFVEPDWGQVLYLALATMALYLIGRGLDLRPASAALFSAALVLAVALGIALARLYLTVYTPLLAALLLALALLLPLLRRATLSFLRRLGLAQTPGTEAWFWRITALAAIVKLGGVLYPHLIVLDVGPHAYRVYRFLSGDADSLFLPSRYSHLGETVGLEGGQFPYSPLFHLLSAPLALLPIPLPLAMGLVNGLLDVARSLLLYLLATRLAGRQRVGLWAALFYAILPAPYYLLSWGNYPTQLGLFAALVALVFLVVQDERFGRWSVLPGWTLVVLLALFSYTVVGVLLAVVLILLVPLELLLSPRPGRLRRAVLIPAGLILAEAIALALYHSNFIATVPETLPALLQAAAAKATGLGPLGVDPRESLLSNWVANWIFVANHLTEIGVVFAGVGVARLFAEPTRRRWRGLLLAWLLIFPLFALFSGLVADMVLKHIFFMFPLFCLGAGVLAETLWRRAWAGRAAALLLALLLAGLSMLRWLEYILVKRH